MRHIAYPAALGCGCLLGTHMAPLAAAEWSVTPLYSASVDYDSNRRLELDSRGSGAAVLTADLLFKRALENTDITLEPRYSLRRYTDSSFGNGDDRSVSAGLDWLNEGSAVNLSAEYWDQSTLLTEALETGLVNGDTHRRLAQAVGKWTWAQTERRQLIANLTYLDVSYYGQERALLPGYRYSSGSVGERFLFSERGSLTLSAYGSGLSSSVAGNSNHEYGIQLELMYSFSERIHFDGSVGESERQLTGKRSHGTDATLSLTRDLTLGKLALNYTRNLVPYGVGYLVERQQVTVTMAHSLTTFVDGNVSALRIENNQLAVLLGVDRRSYDGLSAGLNWHPSQTWAAGVQVSALRTQAPRFEAGTVNEWRGSLTLTWNPRPKTRSW